MKVRELIDELALCDENLEVFAITPEISSESGQKIYTPLRSIMKVRPQGGLVVLHEYWVAFSIGGREGD